MKKGIVIVVCLVLAIALGTAIFFAARGNAQEEQRTLDAVVLGGEEGSPGSASLTLYTLDGGAYANQLCTAGISAETEILGQDGAAIAWQDIPVGSVVRLTHGDVVQAIYPPNFPQIDRVEVTGQADAGQLDAAEKAKAEWEASAVDPGPADSLSGQDDSEAQSAVEPPADAAMYRGTVESITPVGEETEVSLAQAAGTDFGAQKLVVRITGDTRLGFDLAGLQEGNYLEVWYGAVDDTAQDAAYHPAIAANLLPDASLCLFNGTVAELTENGDGTGSILLAPIGEGQETLFQYDDSTQFYLDFSALEVGTELNIYFSGATTRSIPPQAFALEVRPYHALAT